MRKKAENEKAKKLSVSIPANQIRQIEDILDQNDPLAPTTSAIFQAALRDWLEANTEQYEERDEDGRRVLRTRLKRDGQAAAAKQGQPARKRFEDIMDPFSDVF